MRRERTMQGFSAPSAPVFYCPPTRLPCAHAAGYVHTVECHRAVVGVAERVDADGTRHRPRRAAATSKTATAASAIPARKLQSHPTTSSGRVFKADRRPQLHTTLPRVEYVCETGNVRDEEQ